MRCSGGGWGGGRFGVGLPRYGDVTWRDCRFTVPLSEISAIIRRLLNPSEISVFLFVAKTLAKIHTKYKTLRS